MHEVPSPGTHQLWMTLHAWTQIVANVSCKGDRVTALNPTIQYTCQVLYEDCCMYGARLVLIARCCMLSHLQISLYSLLRPCCAFTICWRRSSPHMQCRPELMSPRTPDSFHCVRVCGRVLSCLPIRTNPLNAAGIYCLELVTY